MQGARCISMRCRGRCASHRDAEPSGAGGWGAGEWGGGELESAGGEVHLPEIGGGTLFSYWSFNDEELLVLLQSGKAFKNLRKKNFNPSRIWGRA